MSKHTPGPWWVTRSREVRAHKPAGSPVVLDTVGICDVYSGGHGIDGADANARLIAAAPDLLQALESIRDCCEEDHAARDYASRQTEIRGIARAAIAKAKGEA